MRTSCGPPLHRHVGHGVCLLLNTLVTTDQFTVSDGTPPHDDRAMTGGVQLAQDARTDPRMPYPRHDISPARGPIGAEIQGCPSRRTLRRPVRSRSDRDSSPAPSLAYRSPRYLGTPPDAYQ